jgi:predicted transcriptional regulator
MTCQFGLVMGCKIVTRNIKEALQRLLKRNLIAYTIPDKPSKRQQYKLTALGKKTIEEK